MCIAVVVMYASFRIAGPLYKFNEAVKSIGRGNLHPMMKIRDHDQLKECSISLQATASVINAHIEKVDSLVSILEQSGGYPNNDSSAAKAVKELREEVSFFRNDR
jgi:nitrogen fixation/metabolism regulation signal transduction histidine kinase